MCTVNQNLLDSLLSSLSSLRANLSDDNQSTDSGVSATDSSDLNGTLNALLHVVKAHTEKLDNLQSQIQNSNTTSLEKRIRAQEGELDESKQRGMKGNLLMTSTYTKQGKKERISYQIRRRT